LGVHMTDTGDYYIVTEFLAKGSLLSLLKVEKDNLTLKEKMQLATGAATGMAYLEHERVIHRDLAARNILVEKKNDKYIAKVADFGMSRVTDQGAYVSSDWKLPIKWTAPEVLRREAATSRSDVWSFGVLMWEIWEGGAEPYGWASNKEVYDDVLEGNILKPSKKMPQLIKDLMRKCLSTEAEERPTFQQIVEYFKAHRKEILASAPTTDSPKVTKVKEIEDPIIITKEPSPYASSGPSQQHSSHYVQTPTDSLKPDEEVKKTKS